MVSKKVYDLEKARANLAKAMDDGNPKKIARAAAEVMIADPMSTDTFLYSLAICPLFADLVNDKSHAPYNYHTIRRMVESEMQKIDRKTGKSLPRKYKSMIIKSFTSALKKEWNRDKK